MLLEKLEQEEQQEEAETKVPAGTKYLVWRAILCW